MSSLSSLSGSTSGRFSSSSERRQPSPVSEPACCLSNSKELPAATFNLVVCFFQSCNLPCTDVDTMTSISNTFDLMQRCGYVLEDICTVFAYASAYFRSLYPIDGDVPHSADLGRTLVLLVYIAHTFVLDQTCPLSYWRSIALCDTWSMKLLDSAVMQILAKRHYILRLEHDDFFWGQRTQLLQAAQGLRRSSADFCHCLPSWRLLISALTSCWKETSQNFTRRRRGSELRMRRAL